MVYVLLADLWLSASPGGLAGTSDGGLVGASDEGLFEHNLTASLHSEPSPLVAAHTPYSRLMMDTLVSASDVSLADRSCGGTNGCTH